MDKERRKQEQWQAHTIDEQRAIARQQADAGPTHEPVAESTGQRLQRAADSAGVVERERLLALLAAWRDPAKLAQALGGAPSEETAAALRRALDALEAELLALD